jgi:hypothetical protein
MEHTQALALTRSDVLRIAAEAQADPATVRNFLTGRRMKGQARDRVAAACKRLGLGRTTEHSPAK